AAGAAAIGGIVGRRGRGGCPCGSTPCLRASAGVDDAGPKGRRCQERWRVGGAFEPGPRGVGAGGRARAGARAAPARPAGAGRRGAGWVRFVRSSVASGRIKRIVVPEGATIVTAAELAGVKPIQPLLHKFNYVPIRQPVLAKDVVRFVGEPIAAIVSSTREEAEDVADLVEVEIEELPAVVGAGAALARRAPLVHAEAIGNIVVEGRVKTPEFDAKVAAAQRRIKVDIRSHRQNALPMEPRAAHAAWDAASERVTLTCATQTPHVMRTIIADLIG